MDFLSPQMVTIGERKYRKMYTADGNTKTCLQRETDVFHDEQTNWEDEQCDDEQLLSVQKTDHGYVGYCTDIPSFYFKFICGRKNENRSRIEKETKTHINLPHHGKEGDIVITGPERNGILSAKSRIELIVESARSRSKPTHFISIPVACDEIKKNFEDFKSLVLQECRGCKGFDEAIMQIPEKLHLTMGMMVLMSEQEVGKAAVLLKQIQEEIKRKFIGDRPLKAVLEGIECMNDDPSQVVVLYAKVKLDDGTDRLQMMADFIMEKFSSAGFMRKEYDKVKLHATVINTNFLSIAEDVERDSKSRDYQNKSRRKVSVFDARKVFQICDNFKFGSIEVTTLHLSKRGQYGPDGFYHCESQIDL